MPASPGRQDGGYHIGASSWVPILLVSRRCMDSWGLNNTHRGSGNRRACSAWRTEAASSRGRMVVPGWKLDEGQSQYPWANAWVCSLWGLGGGSLGGGGRWKLDQWRSALEKERASSSRLCCPAASLHHALSATSHVFCRNSQLKSV